MQCLQNIIAKKKVPDNDAVGSRRNVHEEPRQPEQHVDVIGDPVKVSTKGAPKQSTTGRAKKDPNVTKNGRPKSFSERKPGPFVAFVRKRVIDGKRALRMKSKFYIILIIFWFSLYNCLMSCLQFIM